MNLLPAFARPATQNLNRIFTGKIGEKSNKTPVDLANVMLFKARHSTQVAGASTDINGIFKFSNVTEGIDYLQIGYIGFDFCMTASFSLENEILNHGTLEIKISPLVLGNVEIIADKPMFNYSIDCKVYNVEKDILSQTGSASDLMQNIHSVSVNVEGNVSLRGARKVTIFINGKPSLLRRKNSAAVLQQMPAKFD